MGVSDIGTINALCFAWYLSGSRDLLVKKKLFKLGNAGKLTYLLRFWE